MDDISKEQFTAAQLKEELTRLIDKHKSDLLEKDARIRELKAVINVKKRVEEVVHAEYTQEYFPKFIIGVLNLIDPKKKLSFLYIRTMNSVNYMIVCGIGVLINMYILYGLVTLLPLWLANLGAIFVAFAWNWSMSVGPLGFFMGLSPKKRNVKCT